MAGISIPGVTNKYGTNETVEKLMQVERIPLVREQQTLDDYKKQQDAWRALNKKATTLRDSVKSLYSYDNPFNNKVAKSDQESAIKATVTRNATYEDFSIEVLRKATGDKYLSGPLDKDTKVPAGQYTYKISDKTISLKWRGGNLTEFAKALTKRGGSNLKSRVITTTKGKKAISLESMITGRDNRLEFLDDSRTFAISIGMISDGGNQDGANNQAANSNPANDTKDSTNSTDPTAPSLNNPNSSGSEADIANSGEINSTDEAGATDVNNTTGLAKSSDNTTNNSELPDTGGATFDDITINNEGFDAGDIAAILNDDGTGDQFDDDENISNVDYTPLHPITEAHDAVLKYEGITIKRPSNTIDDIVSEVTLDILGETDGEAKISVIPDTESAKDALITFVGKYNQALSQMNILTQNKEELIDEIDYLSDADKDTERERLGIFIGDSSITGLKGAMQSITQSSYGFNDNATITMMSQIGIATNASNYSGYTPSKLRGYLEIDEKTLDEVLEKHLDDVKSLFGYDSDGDLVIDDGLAYRLDKQLTSYVQTGGVFALKTSGLDTKIKSSEQKITKLETQMERKEAELKEKYSQMEGALNSLEGQQTTIQNFNNRNNKQ